MSYLVLARKYRPQNFTEMVGQEHITELLKKAITSERIAHAFLFCGPRGVGKTSCARIMAKSLNCEAGPTLTPCEKCFACQEIAKGSSFDVLEIDGASNRGIDEIRALRENVKFAPGYGRYKVYIVDEVHMLTAEAFNALLKTLEEPPAHAKFIFATTSPNKVPATIISRCQRFDFKRMNLATLQEHLLSICQKEKISISADAMFAITKAAQGSMRDALSILDQLSAISQREIGGADVYSMLGMVETEMLFGLVNHLAGKNCQGALEELEKIVDKGKDLRQLTRDLLEHFRHLMVLKVGGKALGKMVDYPVAAKEVLLEQAQKFTLGEIIAQIEILLESMESARISGFDRMPIEMAFAKMTYAVKTESAASSVMAPRASSSLGGGPLASAAKPETKSSPRETLRNERGHIQVAGSEAAVTKPEEKVPAPLVFAGPQATIAEIKTHWDAITHAVSREKMSLATYLQEGTPIDLREGKVIIGFSPEHKFQKESLEDKNAKRLLEKVFAEKLGSPVVLELRLTEVSGKNADENPVVKSALDTFKGKVINRWHNE